MADKIRKKTRVRKLTENELYQFSYDVANNLNDCALAVHIKLNISYIY